MQKATIYFADNSSLSVSEGDYIIPVVVIPDNGSGSFTSMGEPLEIYAHMHDGLIPAITSAICQCSYFYLNRNGDTVYAANSIVRIKND